MRLIVGLIMSTVAIYHLSFSEYEGLSAIMFMLGLLFIGLSFENAAPSSDQSRLKISQYDIGRIKHDINSISNNHFNNK